MRDAIVGRLERRIERAGTSFNDRLDRLHNWFRYEGAERHVGVDGGGGGAAAGAADGGHAAAGAGAARAGGMGGNSLVK